MTKMTFSKMPHGLPSSPIWLAIADCAGSTPQVAFMLYAQAIDAVSQARYRGGVPGGFWPDDLCSFCQVDEDEIVRICQAIVDRGLVDDHDELKAMLSSWAEPLADDGDEDDDNDKVFDWTVQRPARSERPTSSPAAKTPTAHALRQRRYRARKKEQLASVTPPDAAASPGVTSDAEMSRPGVTRDGECHGQASPVTLKFPPPAPP